jgi:hypothetical protein
VTITQPREHDGAASSAVRCSPEAVQTKPYPLPNCGLDPVFAEVCET